MMKAQRDSVPVPEEDTGEEPGACDSSSQACQHLSHCCHSCIMENIPVKPDPVPVYYHLPKHFPSPLQLI